MDKKSVSSKSETNQELDYKKKAMRIIDSVSEMCRPLGRLKVITELVYGSATGDMGDFDTDKLIGLSSILQDIACDWEKLIDEAHANFSDPKTPEAEEVQQ